MFALYFTVVFFLFFPSSLFPIAKLYLFFVFGTFRFIKGLGKSKSDPMKDTDNQKQNLKSEILPLENPINLTDFEDITDNKNINILKTVENKEIKKCFSIQVKCLTIMSWSEKPKV